LYEILAGKPAYEEKPTYEQTIIQIVTRRPPALREVAPWVPPELADVVHAALTPEIDARLADCGVLARRLAAVGVELGGRPSAMGAAPASAAPAARDARSNTRAMTNDGVAVRSFVRAGPTPAAIAAVAVGVIVLGAVAVAGFRALRPAPAVAGIVAPPVEPPPASVAPPEPVTLPSLPAEAIATPPSSSPPAASAAPPTPSTARAAPHGPPPPAKPPDPTKNASKTEAPVAPGKAQIGSAGVDTQY
jgi:eukaryotic-like serine/threonine-protein kinase